ncbi:zinc ribbon domain-containing protein [Thiospirillum jenense]|uniref:Zinc ribbon domain-containing protein n=1 Tax=Thiospirillum jenense TaxID=1653858 RepID=A0A839H682_9GAMM|nr:zinc ribbon domain-containing protein [Thiospirillum jenense]MBB1125333.1 zinc ribbon domain-containing protein [Thiospirillum jenense]
MALMKCPECGGQVSDQARNCPHCGFPIAEGATGIATTAPAATSAMNAPAATKPTLKLAPRALWQRVSWSFVLFWGGMIVGVMGSDVIGNMQAGGVTSDHRTLFGKIGWVMIFAGIGLFLYNEIRDYRRKQAEELEAEQQAIAAEQAANQQSNSPPTS